MLRFIYVQTIDSTQIMQNKNFAIILIFTRFVSILRFEERIDVIFMVFNLKCNAYKMRIIYNKYYALARVIYLRH